MRTLEEETINAYTHLLWCIISFVFLIFFIIDTSSCVKLKISSLMMVGLSTWTFFSSFLYHVSKDKKKSYNREVDKTSIYLMITGSGAGINLATVDPVVSSVCSSFLILVGMILLGVYSYKKKASEVFSLTSYILLGWLCIFPITGLLGENPYHNTVNMYLIILGGILYSIGILFYARDSIKWNHTKWHFFVMAGYSVHLIAHYRVVQNIA